jgi:hypothetical protein
MIRKPIQPLLFLSFIVACTAPVETEQKVAQSTQIDRPQIVGGDRDAHNCIPSAGYVWSITRNSCVRTWEIGTRLISTRDPQSPSTSIVIENGAGGPMELWLVGGNVPIVLTKAEMVNGYGVWRDTTSGFNITRADLGILELRQLDTLIAKSQPAQF